MLIQWTKGKSWHPNGFGDVSGLLCTLWSCLISLGFYEVRQLEPCTQRAEGKLFWLHEVRRWYKSWETAFLHMLWSRIYADSASRCAMLSQVCVQTTSLSAVGHAWTFHRAGLERGLSPLQADCLKWGTTKLCSYPSSPSVPWISRYSAQGSPALVRGQCSYPNDLFRCSCMEITRELWLSQTTEGAASKVSHSSVNFPSISSQCAGDRQRRHAILTMLLLGPPWEHFPTIANFSGMWRTKGVTLGLCWGLDQGEVLWQKQCCQRSSLRCLEHI